MQSNYVFCMCVCILQCTDYIFEQFGEEDKKVDIRNHQMKKH